MKVSFILLAHEPVGNLKALIGALLTAGSNVFVHHDGSAAESLQEAVKSWGFEQLPGDIFFADRVKVVWGEWSIVQATLNCIDLIQKYDTDSNYFALLSGSCMPVKPVALLEQYLSGSGKDHIEAVDAEKFTWITAGIQKERWKQYHLFNWRYQRHLFDYSLQLQKKLKVNRKIPLGHTPHMGSQWWCLRRSTLMAVHDLVSRRRNLRHFYKRTWVPDELFFQTLVANLVPKDQITDKLITRYQFNGWGIPRVYYDDSFPELLAEEKFFVRKVSHTAPVLRKKLEKIAALEINAFEAYLENDCQEELEELRSRMQLVQHVENNRWYRLESYDENPFDYIKNIPNRMIVVVGADSATKFTALSALDSMEDTVVYGDLFDPKQVGFGYDHRSYLGVGRDAVKLARHTWHQVLGEIAYHSPGQTIVFSLGRNAKPFLDVLRWSAKVHVVMIDGEYQDYHSNKVMEDLYLKSQAYHKLQERNCQLSRISNSDLLELVNLCAENKHSWRYFLTELESRHAKSQWPSLLRPKHDHYAFLKALRSRMLVMVTENETDKEYLTKLLHKKYSLSVFDDVFRVIPNKDQTLDWHYYLSDLAYLNAKATGEHVFAIHLSIDNMPRLETLRWKKELLVVYISNYNVGNDDLVFAPGGAMDQIKSKDKIQAERDLLTMYMQDRLCKFLSYESGERDCLDLDLESWFEKTDSQATEGWLNNG